MTEHLYGSHEFLIGLSKFLGLSAAGQHISVPND